MNKLRIVAMFATLIAILSLSAFAFTGAGTSADPYLINNADDLNALASETQTAGKFFRQTADIEIANVAIGSANAPFEGVYDGYDFAITGLNTNCGLFAFVDGATIKNVNVEGTVTVGAYAAGVVGKAIDATVSNCSFTGTIVDAAANAFTAYVGGICAYADAETVVTDCKANVTAALEEAPYIFYLGGIAGINNGVVMASSANGSISVVSDNYVLAVGGIAGKNIGEVSGSKNNAAISGVIANDAARLYIAGVVGENAGDVERTENTATVTSTASNEYPAYVGGIVGYNVNGVVAESKNTGAVNASASYVGGVLGLNMASEGDAVVSDTLNAGAVATTDGVAGGIAGGSFAMKGEENSSSISASLNTEAVTGGDAAIGNVYAEDNASSDIYDNIATSASNYADTMTTDALLAAENIPALRSNAWLFPKNGLLPQLATVKNLSKTEVIALSMNKAANTVAFSVYNSGASTTAYAVINCYNGTRLAGAKIVEVTIPAGYSAFAYDYEKVAAATSVTVMLLDSKTAISPLAEMSKF